MLGQQESIREGAISSIENPTKVRRNERALEREQERVVVCRAGVGLSVLPVTHFVGGRRTNCLETENTWSWADSRPRQPGVQRTAVLPTRSVSPCADSYSIQQDELAMAVRRWHTRAFDKAEDVWWKG